MKRIIVFILLAISTFACKEQKTTGEHVRKPFDAKGLKVIAVFANRQAQTMSILYGNEIAKSVVRNNYKTHMPGEVFKLVTYKQADNQYWYGSYINGDLLSVENIAAEAIGNNVQLKYVVEEGNVVTPAASDMDRIGFVFSHRVAVFP